MVGHCEPSFTVIASEARQSSGSQPTAARLRHHTVVRPGIEIAASLPLLAMTVAMVGHCEPSFIVIASEARQSRWPQPTAARLRHPTVVRPGIEIAASLPLLAMTVAMVGHCEPSFIVIASEARQSRWPQPTAARLRHPTVVRPGIEIAASLPLLAMTVAMVGHCEPSSTVIASEARQSRWPQPTAARLRHLTVVRPSIEIATSLTLLAMTIAMVGHCEPSFTVVASEARQSRWPQPTAARLRHLTVVRPGIEIAASLTLLAMTVGGRSSQ